MKATNTVRWILTGLASVLMALSALPDVLRVEGALMIFDHLGYPAYLLPFLGAAKLLGVGAILAPGVPRLKEWAFAGLTFDLTGALYSHLSIGDPPSAWMPALVGLMLVGGSYVAHRLRVETTGDIARASSAHGADNGHLGGSPGWRGTSRAGQ